MNKSVKALFALTGTITPENLPALRAAVVENIAAHPDRDANSQLIGIYSEIAAKVGRAESISVLCAEAKVDGTEKTEADAWSALIQDWELSPTFTYEKDSDVFAPETEYLKKESGNTRWTKLDPKDVLGIVFIQPALVLKDEELPRRVVYARTEIESATDRSVTFASGSDDWLKVWVNGEEVLVSMRNRSMALDQDRFRVPLKAGKNSVFLKVGNATESWSFALRLVSDSDNPLVTASR